MAELPNEITEIQTLDTARILNQEKNEWEKGWLSVYKRHHTEPFFANKTVDTTKEYSAVFLCAPYSSFDLLINFTASGVAGNLTIEVEVSDDNANWHKKTDVPFGSLKWEGQLGNKKEAVQGKCIAQYYRLTAVSSAGSWLLTAKAVFIT